MSKEEQFEGFEKQLRAVYNDSLIDPLLEIIKRAFFCGYAGGYAESINESSVFIKNQVDSFNLEFSEYTQK